MGNTNQLKFNYSLVAPEKVIPFTESDGNHIFFIMDTYRNQIFQIQGKNINRVKNIIQ